MRKEKQLLLMLSVLFTVTLFVGVSAFAGSRTPKGPKFPAPVPQTGQSDTYYPGDDGDLRMGVACPDPRLTDNRDGTVTDNLTGLMWLQDANCISTMYPDFDNDAADGVVGDGRVTWKHALDFVAGINNGTYANGGAGYTDWRLPNINEFYSLFDYEVAFGGPPCLPVGHPFSIDNSDYMALRLWTATTVTGRPGFSYFVALDICQTSSAQQTAELPV